MMPSIPQLLIILAIVILLFGAKRLRNIGSDLGSAIKGFRKAVKEEDGADKDKIDDHSSGRVIDAEVSSKKHDKV